MEMYRAKKRSTVDPKPKEMTRKGPRINSCSKKMRGWGGTSAVNISWYEPGWSSYSTAIVGVFERYGGTSFRHTQEETCDQLRTCKEGNKSRVRKGQ